MSDAGRDLRVIVAGCGRVGIAATRILHHQGHGVVAIEEDEDQVEAISDEYVATVIAGDATRPSTLAQADPEGSDAIAALTGDAAVNYAVCGAARQANPDIRTVMRIADDDDRDEFDGDVDEVVYPEEEGAKVAVELVVGRTIRRLTGGTGAIEVLSVDVAEGAPAAGKPLREVNFPRGSLVVTDVGGDTIAGPDSVLEPGEHVLVAVEPSVEDEVRQLLRG